MIKLFNLFLLLFLISPAIAQHSQQAPSNPTPDKNKPLNIDYLYRGHFYAASPRTGVYDGYGGWGGSGNSYHAIVETERPKTAVSIIADSESESNFFDVALGMKVYLYNTTSDTVFFSAQDSRLTMKVQAKDEKGEWTDIEYLPSSWCGNSYHTLFLPPNHYWEFDSPVFEGSFQTEMRVTAYYYPEFDGEAVQIFSNTYAGSVNPGQFVNKEGYECTGIMDPYDD